MLTQTLAIFADAYRELNARKLFWITLAISGAVVLGFAAVGINQRGLNFLGFFIGPWINSDMVPPDRFYTFVFTTIGVPIWLTWGATILALASTAGIFPDFVAGGAIDVLLSKPIGRFRLFVTKYLAALTFVALQAAVFSGAVFLVIGLRGHSWDPKVFLTVPLVLAFYSFIYCVCVLVGMRTKSTIAALIAAIIFWMAVWAVHTTETVYLTVLEGERQDVLWYEAHEKDLEAQIARLDAAPAPSEQAEPPAAADPAPGQGGVLAALGAGLREMLAVQGNAAPRNGRERLQERLDKTRQDLEISRKDVRSYTRGHDIVFAVKTVLPKTSETMQLLTRAMLSQSDIASVQPRDGPPEGGHFRPRGVDSPPMWETRKLAGEEVQRIVRARSVWWVLGTSLAFEAAVVGLAAWMFCRRDF